MLKYSKIVMTDDVLSISAKMLIYFIRECSQVQLPFDVKDTYLSLLLYLTLIQLNKHI